MARSSPEIDIIEAQIDSGLGARGSASQSAQFAPFNAYYQWDNATYATFYMAPDDQHLNTYGGGVYQQAASTVSLANQDCYQLPAGGGQGCYSIYGFQYKPGYAEDNAYITWINDDKLSWRMDAAGFGPDANTGVSARPVSKEPMVRILLYPGLPSF
jgi:beta-glucan synthesis-associated protein KRE6